MKIFITGMAGTLGTALTLLHQERGDTVLGCSRNEERCIRWQQTYGSSDKVRIIPADARWVMEPTNHDLIESVDRCYHCAAMKHIDLCEREPGSAWRENVQLTEVVVGAFGDRVILASTDKAYQPKSVYGASKLIAERLVTNAGGAVVRLGNLIGSSGSVFRTWKEALDLGEYIRVTDPDMTRWFIPTREAARFMADNHLAGSVVYPTDMKAIRMGDIAEALAGTRVDVVGPRPGEEKHQSLSEYCRSDTAKLWNTGDLLQEAGLL